MADTSEVIRALRESLGGAPGPSVPATRLLGEWLEAKVAGAPYLSRDWVPRAQPSFELGSAEQHPGLRRLSEPQRRELMFAVRPARALRGVTVVRTEALLAGLAEGDVERMHDGLWTYGRLALADRLNSSSGTDHSADVFDHLEETAVGDDLLALDRLPDDAPLARRGYRFAVVASNLIRALRHGHDRDVAREDAVRFAAGASTKRFEALLTDYLVAVLDADADAASRHLDAIARTWASTPWARNWKDPLHRVASLKLHGLAALGDRTVPGLAEVAATSPAWNADLARLVAARRGAAHAPRSVVELPGVTSSLAVILTPRPFADTASRAVAAPQTVTDSSTGASGTRS